MRSHPQSRGYQTDAWVDVLKASGWRLFIVFHLLAAVPTEQGKSMECSGGSGQGVRATAQELPPLKEEMPAGVCGVSEPHLGVLSHCNMLFRSRD